jgi:hypothetical protein
MVDVAGGVWIHPASVTAWTLSLLLAGGTRIWPATCGSGQWREDVVPCECDAHSHSSQITFVIRDVKMETRLASGVSWMGVSYVVILDAFCSRTHG